MTVFWTITAVVLMLVCVVVLIAAFYDPAPYMGPIPTTIPSDPPGKIWTAEKCREYEERLAREQLRYLNVLRDLAVAKQKGETTKMRLRKITQDGELLLREERDVLCMSGSGHYSSLIGKAVSDTQEVDGTAVLKALLDTLGYEAFYNISTRGVEIYEKED